jgi:hypothetical protein
MKRVPDDFDRRLPPPTLPQEFLIGAVLVASITLCILAGRI